MSHSHLSAGLRAAFRLAPSGTGKNETQEMPTSCRGVHSSTCGDGVPSAGTGSEFGVKEPFVPEARALRTGLGQQTWGSQAYTGLGPRGHGLGGPVLAWPPIPWGLWSSLALPCLGSSFLSGSNSSSSHFFGSDRVPDSAKCSVYQLACISHNRLHRVGRAVSSHMEKK